MNDKSKVILFPTNRIVNKNRAKEDPKKGEKVRLDATKDFVEGHVDEIAMNILRAFVKMAMKTDKPEFTKDLGLLVDVMRGMIYRDFDVVHPAQKLVDKIVQVETTRFGPKVLVDYNKVIPNELKDGSQKDVSHKPNKPLSKDIRDEIKKTNDGWTDFQSPDIDDE